jgi:hypothetical protein
LVEAPEDPRRGVQERVPIDVVPAVCRVDRSVQPLPVIGVAHRRRHHDLVLEGQSGQRDPLTVEVGEVDLHVVEGGSVEPLWLDVQEGRPPRFGAVETHGARGLEGRGALGQIELDAVSGDIDEGRVRPGFHPGQVGHARHSFKSSRGPPPRSVRAVPGQ